MLWIIIIKIKSEISFYFTESCSPSLKTWNEFTQTSYHSFTEQVEDFHQENSSFPKRHQWFRHLPTNTAQGSEVSRAIWSFQAPTDENLLSYWQFYLFIDFRVVSAVISVKRFAGPPEERPHGNSSLVQHWADQFSQVQPDVRNINRHILCDLQHLQQPDTVIRITL